ncbi:hypothetical protein O0I55_14275 [Stenotrophomonas sp. Sm5341]|nr:hypothetical protein [Stenotrophomonas sp. Sm5341]
MGMNCASVVPGGDELREALAPHHDGGVVVHIHVRGHLDQEAVEGLHFADALSLRLDLKEVGLVVDEVTDQVHLVIRARSHLPVEGDLGGTDTDLAFGPVHCVAALQVAAEGGAVGGVFHGGLYLFHRRVIGGDQDRQEVDAQAEAQAEGEQVGGEQDEDAAHGASLWLRSIARRKAGRDHPGR